MNYFQLFEIPAQFDVDKALLSQRYQRLQKLTHPDKFATASDAEKRVAMQKNAQINDAYYVLNDPVKRAEHLLQCEGVELRSDQDSMRDTQFLIEQMEWREQLEDAQSKQDLSQLNDLSDALQSKIHSLKSELAIQLHSPVENGDAALNLIAKLKFMVKVEQQVDDIIDQIEEDM